MGDDVLRARAAEGWVLLEVLVAMALLTILVGSLTAGVSRAGDRVTALDDRWADSSVGTRIGADAWRWGMGTAEACWMPGPVLEIGSATVEHGEGRIIGLWIDGWPIFEAGASQTGTLTLGPTVWAHRVGSEVVLRVRGEEGAWGPPFRTVVPEATGLLTPAGLSSDDHGSLAAIVHVRRADSATIEMTGDGMVVPGLSGFPYRVSGLTSTLCGVRANAVEQWWVRESARELDVYF